MLWLTLGAPILFACVWQLAYSAMGNGIISYGWLLPVEGVAGLLVLSISIYGLTRILHSVPGWVLALAILFYAMLLGGVIFLGGGLISCLNGDCF